MLFSTSKKMKSAVRIKMKKPVPKGKSLNVNLINKTFFINHSKTSEESGPWAEKF